MSIAETEKLAAIEAAFPNGGSMNDRYYHDYDEDTASWCVFHPADNPPHAYFSYACELEASERAQEMNREGQVS